MPNKIPEEVKTKIRELYSKGFRISEIVGHTGISYTSVYGLTRLRERINPETGNPFQSLRELTSYRVRNTVNPETGNPFESLTEYDNYRAKQRINPVTGENYRSKVEYNYQIVKNKINPETGNPFQSRSEYDNYRLKQRSEREYNKFLKNFINKRLKDLGKKQSWLAREMHLTRSAIHNYVKGITLPNKNNLGKLLSILQEAPKTLEDLTS